MSRDLTRWNRAGLDRFRYVDGTAATWLEELRLALLTRFLGPLRRDGSHPDAWWDELARDAADPAWWRGLLSDGVPAGQEERVRLALEAVRWDALVRGVPARSQDARERIQALLDQYHGEREDGAWEVTRALSRSLHVLTEHLDAYANEGFLRTATQWESVRRLVAMIGAHPAPPASASTTLAVDAAGAGVLPQGFQVRHKPPEGGEPVIFETLAELEVAPELNGLRPRDHDRSPEAFQGPRLVLEGAPEGLEAGQPLVLEDERSGALSAYRIQGVRVGEAETEVWVRPAVGGPFVRGWTRVHAAPADAATPVAPASDQVQLGRAVYLQEEPDDLGRDDLVWIGDGERDAYARVADVRGRRLVVTDDVGPMSGARGTVARAERLPVSGRVTRRDLAGDDTRILVLRVAGDHGRLVGSTVSHTAPGLPLYRVSSADYRAPGSGRQDEGYTHLRLTWDHDRDLLNPQVILVPPLTGGVYHLDRFVVKDDGALPDVLTVEEPKKTAAGDLAVVLRGNQMAWARLASVEVDADAGTADLVADGGWEDRGGGEYFLAGTTVFAGFETVARPRRHERNDTPLTGTTVEVGPAPALLRRGRRVLVEAEGAGRDPLLSAVARVRGGPGATELTLEDPLPPGATAGNLVIRGNLVEAGHGESQDERVLGSGDSTRLHQAFDLDETAVSFVADPAQPSGVRAAVTVRVGPERWRQVPTLAPSGPTDAHYTVRVNEDGSLRLEFGDGRRGRRLPTGRDNVRIRFRKGVGLGGNVPAGSLEEPVSPHALVEAVRQPLDATGGNDMEGVDTLRASAPASVLTLGRAVSLDDFGRLAARQASVWQARAFALPPGLGRRDRIRVVVVPAGGGSLGDDVGGTLVAFLESHALPDVQVLVEGHGDVPVRLEITIQVRGERFDPEEVRGRTQEAVERAFSLERRELGQILHTSSVYRVVESLEGVENSRVVMDEDPSVLARRPDPDQVVHLGAAGSVLQVRAEEYEP